MIFKAEKLCALVSGVEHLPVAQMAAQIAVGSPPLPIIGAIVIGAWEDKFFLSLTTINNCLQNNIVTRIQSCTSAHHTWKELIKLFESHGVVPKMFLKDKLHTLKMKENESIVKHIHNRRAHLEQLLATSSAIHDDEAILT